MSASLSNALQLLLSRIQVKGIPTRRISGLRAWAWVSGGIWRLASGWRCRVCFCGVRAGACCCQAGFPRRLLVVPATSLVPAARRFKAPDWAAWWLRVLYFMESICNRQSELRTNARMGCAASVARHLRKEKAKCGAPVVSGSATHAQRSPGVLLFARWFSCAWF